MTRRPETWAGRLDTADKWVAVTPHQIRLDLAPHQPGHRLPALRGVGDRHHSAVSTGTPLAARTGTLTTRLAPDRGATFPLKPTLASSTREWKTTGARPRCSTNWKESLSKKPQTRLGPADYRARPTWATCRATCTTRRQSRVLWYPGAPFPGGIPICGWSFSGRTTPALVTRPCRPRRPAVWPQPRPRSQRPPPGRQRPAGAEPCH